jgi:hypothetical protein
MTTNGPKPLTWDDHERIQAVNKGSRRPLQKLGTSRRHGSRFRVPDSETAAPVLSDVVCCVHSSSAAGVCLSHVRILIPMPAGNCSCIGIQLFKDSAAAMSMGVPSLSAVTLRPSDALGAASNELYTVPAHQIYVLERRVACVSYSCDTEMALRLLKRTRRLKFQLEHGLRCVEQTTDTLPCALCPSDCMQQLVCACPAPCDVWKTNDFLLAPSSVSP